MFEQTLHPAAARGMQGTRHMTLKDEAMESVSPLQKQNVIFIHPDLGIGGAERLIIDAAVGLQGLGHKVTIFTSHCDPTHCFDEARDGTLDVRVRGNTIFPPTFLNRFHILLATFRQLHLVLAVSVLTNELRALRPDAFIVDQLSACVPLLRWLWPVRQRILFYCHFPDQLLAQRNEKGLLGLVKRAYRLPFDWFEGWSMNASDRIVVNSAFTRSVVTSLFKGLGNLRIIHPCVDTEAAEKGKDETPLWGGKRVLLSINRFERKKDVGLAIRAYHGLTPPERQNCRLVLAGETNSFAALITSVADWDADLGGYDQRVSENVEYHKELEHLANSLELSHATAKTIPTALAIPSDIEILFLLSVPGAFKSTLLHNANLLVYTPTNEHFGIVPVEAMYQGVPVLAANTGGPLETVVEDQTGWLRDVKKVNQWTEVMRKVLFELSLSDIEMFSRNGKERVNAEFSRRTMARRFENVLEEMAESQRKLFLEWRDILLAIAICGAFGFVIGFAMTKPNTQRAS